MQSLRVIGANGENYGVISREEAQNKADEVEKDLVLIAEEASPPVAKILDFNKFLYEERKKESAAKAKSKKSELKELRLSSTIGEGDLMQRVVRAKEFLAGNNRVKFNLKLRGREFMNPKLAFEKVNKVLAELSEVARVEEEPKIVNKSIIVVVLKK